MKDYKLKSGNILRVIQDESPESPDKWENKDIFLVYDHKQFTIKREGFEPIDIFDYITYNKNIPNREDQLEKHGEVDDRYDDYFIFPVDAYIHSGVHLSLANTKDYPDRRWDVSTTGYILVNKESVTQGEKDSESEQDARSCAKVLINSWNQYLSGDVWKFKVLKPIKYKKVFYEDENELLFGIDNPNLKVETGVEYEELDSCYNFYGSDPKTNGMLDNINDEIIEENEQDKS